MTTEMMFVLTFDATGVKVDPMDLKKKSSFETGQMGIIGFGVISCCT